MDLRTARFRLRDFAPHDRAALVAYQRDPRYRLLYNIDASDDRTSHELFDRFLDWRRVVPRQNFQVGIFERGTERLCGCAGLRRDPDRQGTAALGIELAPDQWGRYRLAVEIVTALLEHGFGALELHTIVGTTTSSNQRVEKLARWFNAEIVAHRPGPDWMAARGWHEIEWKLTRSAWARSGRERRL
jgi:[ribosomal protein S5]-alanine N-acetyltransferase